MRFFTVSRLCTVQCNWSLQLILLLVTGVLDSYLIPTTWYFQWISYENQPFQWSKHMITKCEIVLWTASCRIVHCTQLWLSLDVFLFYNYKTHFVSEMSLLGYKMGLLYIYIKHTLKWNTQKRRHTYALPHRVKNIRYNQQQWLVSIEIRTGYFSLYMINCVNLHVKC